MNTITKTLLYNFDPLNTPLLNSKTGVYRGIHYFLISTLKHRLLNSLEPPHNLCFEQKYGKYRNFLSEKFPFLVAKISKYLNRRVFVMYN